MLRGTVGLLGLLCVLSGCNGPVGAGGVEVTTTFVLKYHVGTALVTETFTLPANRTSNVELEKKAVPSKLVLSGKCHNAAHTNELTSYTAVIGPASTVYVTPENWLHLDSGWLFIGLNQHIVFSGVRQKADRKSS